MTTIGTRPTTQFQSSYSSALGATSMAASTTSFTSELRKTLIESRSIIDTWVSSEKLRIDRYVTNAKHEISMKQKQIDTSSAQLLALQLQHGCTIDEKNISNNIPLNSDPNTGTTKNVLSEQQIVLENKIQQQAKINQRLEAQLDSLKKQIEELSREEDDYKARAIAMQRQATTIQTSKDVTVHDLTRGMVNYKYLGLDFQRAENDRLKFTFTQLNPNDPNQEYSFYLGATNGDLWAIYDCSPIHLSEATLNELIEPLNRTDDMLSFTRNIRHAFVQHIYNGYL